jgi:hypothetical protein
MGRVNHPSSQRGGTALPHFQSHGRQDHTAVLMHGVRLVLLVATCVFAWIIHANAGQASAGIHPATFWILVALAAAQLAFSLVHLLRNRSVVFKRRLFARPRWR